MMRFPVLLGGLLLLVRMSWAQTFTAATFYPLGAGEPRGVATADFNNDGNPDIAVTRYDPGTIMLLLGTGTGSFQASTDYSTGLNSRPMDMAVGDVNNDGYPDVLVANAGTSAIGVLLGTGTGTLQPVISSPVMGTPLYLRLADMNADGKADIVVALATNSFNSFSVLLGNGNGTFQCCSSGAATSILGGLVVGDVNGDNKLDIVTASAQRAASTLYLGNGDGTIQAALTYTTNPNGTGMLRLGDLNADGKVDIGFASGNYNYVGTLLGNGNGTFQPLVNYTVGVNAYPDDISLRDMNADGKLDMALVRKNPASLQILLNDGNGGFPTSKIFPTGVAQYSPQFLMLSDVNRDGQLDAVAAAYYFTNSVFYMGVEVLLNTTFLPTRAALPGIAATLAPNPATAAATLTATGLPAAAHAVQAVLLNSLGQEVRRLTVPATAGAATGTVPTTGLAAGLYLLQLDAVDARGAALGALPVQRLSVE